MLIPDLAHQLLHDVLQGAQALGAAVLVHHDDHVGLGLLEDAQQIGDLGVGGGVEHGGDDGGDVVVAVVAGGVEVLLVDDAHDVVDVLMVDRQPGVAALGEGLGDLVHGIGVLHRHDVHPGGEDLIHLQVAELDGGADKLALILVQTALGLGLVHHGDELLLSDAAVAAAAEDQTEQTLPLSEEEVQGTENEHQQPQNGGGEHGKGLGLLLGQALGGDLAEDQDDHGEHDGGHRGAVGRAHVLGEEDGAQGGGRDVHDVVADEDGGQQTVVVLRQGQGAGGPAVSGVGLALQADAVEGGEGGLGGGEVGGKGHHQEHGCDHCDTLGVHSDDQLNFLLSLDVGL